MEKTWFLEKISYKFLQEGNTLGTTMSDEWLEIDVEASIGSIEEEGGFLVLKSSTGWSFNDKEELLEILNLAEKGVNIIK